MTVTHCPHCGEFIEPEKVKPVGCVCDAQEWLISKIPDVCHKFIDGGYNQCKRCEHGAECHKA